MAKAAHYLVDEESNAKPFSMVDIKTQYANELLLERFISTFGIDPQMSKIKSIRENIRCLGKIDA